MVGGGCRDQRGRYCCHAERDPGGRIHLCGLERRRLQRSGQLHGDPHGRHVSQRQLHAKPPRPLAGILRR